jgi:hypothetical protein
MSRLRAWLRTSGPPDTNRVFWSAILVVGLLIGRYTTWHVVRGAIAVFEGYVLAFALKSWAWWGKR